MKSYLHSATTTILFVLLIAGTLQVSGQADSTARPAHFPKHFISVNPLNCLLFQQLGLTYEFRPGRMGYGITGGYIYPNHQEYSNFFIAGPTSNGSLGDYSGWFVVPQVNVYLLQPKHPEIANLIYISLKGVYKHMEIDSTQKTAWSNEGDGYYLYRKMNDQVSVYGGFIDFGYKLVVHHFFIDLNLGLGVLSVNHDMVISAQWMSNYGVQYYHPPKTEETHEVHPTINFTINLGGAF